MNALEIDFQTKYFNKHFIIGKVQINNLKCTLKEKLISSK